MIEEMQLLKRWWTVRDWLAVIGVCLALVAFPLWFRAATGVEQGVSVTPEAVHHKLPAIFDIILSPSISLGNVLTVLGMIWWVGRWGAKTIALVDSIPEKLDKFDDRLEALEKQGCYRLDEHRAVIKAIRKNHPDVKFDNTEDL